MTITMPMPLGFMPVDLGQIGGLVGSGLVPDLKLRGKLRSLREERR